MTVLEISIVTLLWFAVIVTSYYIIMYNPPFPPKPINMSAPTNIQYDAARDELTIIIDDGVVVKKLTQQQSKHLIQLLHNVFYDKKTDIFELPTPILVKGEQHGIS